MGTGQRSSASAARRAPGGFIDDSGLTLIEMMVAFAVLAIVLAATAGSLIAFTRTAAENERRVQATAILNEAQERMHAAPWEIVGVYENELAPLADAGDYTAGNPSTFESDEIVELPSWDDGSCTWTTFEEAVTCGRERGTPRTSMDVERDGHPYTIHNVVTWVDRSGDGIGDVKRLTSVATWELLGREHREVFISERAPTNIEAGDPQRPRLIQLDLEPRELDLTADHQLPRDIEVQARFTSGVESAELRFYVVDQITTETTVVDGEQREVITGATLKAVTVPLTNGIPDPDDATKHVSFRGHIPSTGTPAFQFTDGPRKIRAIGIDNGEEFSGVRTLDLHGEIPHQPDPGDPPPPERDASQSDPTPLAVSTPGPSRSGVTQTNDRGNRLFCQDLTISATVDGLNAEDVNSVTTSFSVGTEQIVNRPLVPASNITGTNDLFTYTFEAGKDHGFRNNHQTTFNIHVERISGGEASALGSDAVTFTQAGGSGC